MGIFQHISVEDFCIHNSIEYKMVADGKEINIRECPSCGNEKYKVFINTDKNVGHCKRCGQIFNFYGFVKAYTGLTGQELRQAVAEVADISKTSLAPVKTQAEPILPKEGDVPLPANYKIPINNKNVEYLEKRGIPKKYASYFDLRLCIEGYSTIRKTDGTSKTLDFSKTILIPIKNIDGKIITFQGRDITGQRENKYLFPSALRSSGYCIYNIDNAIGKNSLIINEGVFDVISTKIALDSLGVESVEPIGTFGKHLGHKKDSLYMNQLDQLNLLKKHGLKTITMMWDGEVDAYDQAVKMGYLIFQKLAIRVRIAELPIGKDPNEVTPRAVYDAFMKAKEIKGASDFLLLRKNNPYLTAKRV